MKGTVTKMCRGGLLSSFILISYIALTTSMTLDLTELRNKVSKLKVNPRGNLWATGHFMGKKSIVDSSFVNSAFENIKDTAEGRDVRPLHGVEDLQALLIHILKTAQQTQGEQALDREEGHPVRSVVA
ncbi:neuromedin Ba [Pundamilia nyererei]|uniref:Bombesin-like n=3 Tax=Haplochromini TaxID=319058 RepID=A0A3Q2VP50_HAPBU|nr:PREDICTED: neuromedin-B [Pundamilia nyererei]XP_026031736.1 bombesin-like [Astatotilapia calliptera]